MKKITNINSGALESCYVSKEKEHLFKSICAQWGAEDIRKREQMLDLCNKINKYSLPYGPMVCISVLLTQPMLKIDRYDPLSLGPVQHDLVYTLSSVLKKDYLSINHKPVLGLCEVKTDLANSRYFRTGVQGKKYREKLIHATIDELQDKFLRAFGYEFIKNIRGNGYFIDYPSYLFYPETI